MLQISSKLNLHRALHLRLRDIKQRIDDLCQWEGIELQYEDDLFDETNSEISLYLKDNLNLEFATNSIITINSLL